MSFFVDQHMVFGDTGKGCVLAKGYAVNFPALDTSGDDAFTNLESDLRLMLGSLSADERIQLQVYSSSDAFSVPIDRYADKTKASKVEIVSEVREELARRFRARMAANTLIQNNARLYISSKMPAFIKEGSRPVRGFEATFRVIQRSFEQRQLFFDLLLRGYGGAVTPMTDIDHYRELLQFWSPGQALVWNPEASDIDWLRSIPDLCRFSDMAPRNPPECGFHLDSHVFGVLVYKTMPRSTWMKSMQAFQALTIPGLRITLNMQPLPVESEMKHESERFSKLMSNIAPDSHSLESEVGLSKHKQRMERLMSNEVLPFRCQIVVLVSDKTRDGVDAKVESARVAIGKSGAEPHQALVPTAAVSFFDASTPGYGPWSGYPDYFHRIDDLNLAHMWPAGSTPKGDLDEASVIFDNDRNGLMGGKLYNGAQPAHMLVSGSTGDGKSTLVQTIALQAAHEFSFIAVLDSGSSWSSTCHALDSRCQPIVIRSNSSATFNCLDTGQLPLSPDHLANAVGLVHMLVGSSRDEDRDKMRASLLEQAIQEVYSVFYRRWRNANPERHYRLCHEAAALIKFQQDQGIETFIDAFLESKALLRGNIEILTEYGMNEDAAMSLDRNPETAHIVESLAFASFTPAMFPQLSHLQDQLHSDSLQKGPHQESLSMLSNLLVPWLRSGRHGALLDGPNSVFLGDAQVTESDPLRVVNFELEKIGESQTDLRAVVSFVISNQLQNIIRAMPRGLKKQVVVEEVGAFLKMPNGGALLTDYYQRMRRYNCQVISIFQDYGSLLQAHPAATKAIISNSSVMLMLRTTSRAELDLLSTFIRLPEVVKDKIRSFPKPEAMKGRDDCHAAFVWADLTGTEPKFTVGRNYISEQVERLTTSSGDQFERKQKDLRASLKGQDRNGLKGIGSNGNGSDGTGVNRNVQERKVPDRIGMERNGMNSIEKDRNGKESKG